MKNEITVQSLAECLRDVAYGDNQAQRIRWSLDVIHPRTDDGVVGYSGGIWHDLISPDDEATKTARKCATISIQFSFDEINGVKPLHKYEKDENGWYKPDETQTFTEIKPLEEYLAKSFHLTEIYRHGGKSEKVNYS